MKRFSVSKGIYPAPLSHEKGGILKGLPSTTFWGKSGAGFTIPELLVSLFIFSLVIVGAGGLLVSSIGVQRRAGAQQELMDQASYLAEYMSRALRQARKDLTGACLTTAGVGFNYELNTTPVGSRISFLNRNNVGDLVCKQFLLSGTQIMERTSSDATAVNLGLQVALTSNNLQVTKLGFYISGAGQGDNSQPKATFAIELNGEVRIQTTVSQRDIDIPK
ncbi:MAG: prepilin-type N-terminal cleavage/methylation domain-containing protein [bacterium]|nr:prepilin-type N-terminal cleavage/methylation domain-containing protein [bacterium]